MSDPTLQGQGKLQTHEADYSGDSYCKKIKTINTTWQITSTGDSYCKKVKDNKQLINNLQCNHISKSIFTTKKFQEFNILFEFYFDRSRQQNICE